MLPFMSFLTMENVVAPSRSAWGLGISRMFVSTGSRKREASHAEDGSQRLAGLDKLLGSNGIVLVGVDWDVGKGTLEGVGVEEGAAGWDDRSRHDGDDDVVCVVIGG